MKSKKTIPLSEIPEGDLRFFHGLSNWVEESKTSNPHLMSWKKGVKALTKLTFIKPKKGKKINCSDNLLSNTLYVPQNSSGKYVFRQLRNAFCHNGLKYDNITKQLGCSVLCSKINSHY